MIVPYSAAFALLSITQGVLVLPGLRRRWSWERFRWLGVVVPAALLIAGLALIRFSDVTTRGLANSASIIVPALAAAVAWARGWRAAALVAPVLVLVLFLVAWQADGLTADLAALILIGGSCLTVAALIAAVAPARTVAIGLVALAVIDAILVFSNQVEQATDALRIIVPAEVVGRPLPSLQDASVDGALMGWLDLLAPAVAGTLLAGMTRLRMWAAVAVGTAALVWGLMFHITDHLPGTIPPLAAVAVWAAASRTRVARSPVTDADRVRT